MSARRILAATAAAITFLVAGAQASLADGITNTVDASVDAIAEAMPLNVGGAVGTTTLVWVINDQGKNGCDLTGQTTFSANVVSSNTSVATVSPSSVTFSSCGDVKSLTVTPVAIGTSQITLIQTANTTGQTIDLLPARFNVNVAPPANTAPVVSLTGVAAGASYAFGAVPSAHCSVVDQEDGNRTFDATLSPISGGNAASGIGNQTATCSATDAGGLTATVSAIYSIVPAATTTTVTCTPTSVVYDGNAQTPCTATVTGGGGLSTPTAVSYSANTAVGTATASAAYAGSATHTPSNGSATFAITQAPSTTTVSCPSSTPWTGSPITPCTVEVTGAGGLRLTPAPSYAANTGVGTATASFNYGGDTNHAASNGSANFEIVRAASHVSITCIPGQVYTGLALTPCTATVTSTGLSQDVQVTYGDNTKAGTATASAQFLGDGTHAPATGSTTFAIAKADSSVTIACDPATYTGLALQPCTATVHGDGVVTGSATLEYNDNTNAGTGSVTATYAGDANHDGSSNTTSFTIAKAAASVTVTCAAGPFTYNGAAQTPCTAIVTGSGGLSLDLDVDYADTNVNAGTARAYAEYEGDANHTGDTDDESFEIGRATPVVSLSCPTGVVYDGAAHPCTATVQGVGTELAGAPVTVAYKRGASSTTDVTSSGTLDVKASYGGGDNYIAAGQDGTLVIGKATPVVALSCPTGVVYDGAAHPCTATVQGIGTELAGASVTVAYSRGGSATADVTSVGTVAVLASYAGGANYTSASKTGTLTIAAWTTPGFYQPVDMGSTVLNTVKAGSTVPLKFELFSGSTELTNVSAVKSFGAKQIVCGTTPAEDAIELTTTGGTSLRYDSTGGQFIQNWQTPKATAGTCYQVTMRALDDSTITAYFKLK